MTPRGVRVRVAIEPGSPTPSPTSTMPSPAKRRGPAAPVAVITASGASTSEGWSSIWTLLPSGSGSATRPPRAARRPDIAAGSSRTSNAPGAEDAPAGAAPRSAWPNSAIAGADWERAEPAERASRNRPASTNDARGRMKRLQGRTERRRSVGRREGTRRTRPILLVRRGPAQEPVCRRCLRSVPWPVMRFRRIPPLHPLNPWAAELEARRAAGGSWVDLTLGNPTLAGLAPDPAILQVLADPRGVCYQPDPRGLLLAREAGARDLTGPGTPVEPGQGVLPAGTTQAYAHLSPLLAGPGGGLLRPAPGL